MRKKITNSESHLNVENKVNMNELYEEEFNRVRDDMEAKTSEEKDKNIKLVLFLQEIE